MNQYKPNEQLINLFKAEIDNRPGDVDPNGEEDWYSLTVGWGIAKGLLPDEAREFATYIRYETDLA